MIAKCARCQYVFTTDRYGRQFCPSCGAELVLPAPSGGPPPAGPPSNPSRPPSAPQAQPADAPVPPHAAQTGPAAGARCSAHPDRPASDICARCGAFACSECLQPGADGLAQCPACRARTGEVEPVPWEERDRRGLVAAYYETLKKSFAEPVRFFERMRVDGSEGTLSFFWITTAIGALLGQGWQALFAAVGFNPLGGTPPDLPEGSPFAAWLEASNSPYFALAMGVAVALVAPVSLYLNAGVFHLGLMLFKGSKNGFDATLRAIAYGSGPNLLQVVPMCGNLVGLVWMVVLWVIGLSRLHRTSTGVAVAAVLVPLVVITCCSCGMLVVAAAVGGVALAGAMGAP